MSKGSTSSDAPFGTLLGYAPGGVIILVYSVLNIIGIANGSICLDTPEDADFAKVEAEMAADADKENKED